MTASRYGPFLALLGGLAALSVAPRQAGAQVQEAEVGFALRAGDRVTVKLYTASGDEVGVVGGARTVDQNGEIFLPYVQSITVSGWSQGELRTLLTHAYSEFFDNPVLDVEVELGVSITGAVGSPGRYYVDPTATVLDALAEAGGMGPEIAINDASLPADQNNVRLVRDNATTILNLAAGEVSEDVRRMLVQSGDWIHVPYRSRSRVREEIQFWGSIIGFVSNVVAVIVLLSG